MPSNKSLVWRHFVEGRVDGCKIATCRLCEEPQVFKCPQNTTTPLWKHLEKKHKDEHTLEDPSDEEEEPLTLDEELSDSSSEEESDEEEEGNNPEEEEDCFAD